MKAQFSVRSLLIATAFLGIWITIVKFWIRMSRYAIGMDLGSDDLLELTIYSSPLWSPLLFAGYVFGRRTLSARILLAFVMAESLLLGIIAAQRYLNPLLTIDFQ